MPLRRKRFLGASCVLAMSAAMLAMLIALWSRHVAHTAKAMQAQLEQLPDDELLPHLRRMSQLGDAALPALCETLGSSRPAAAEAAQVTLREELARWELLTPRQAGIKLAKTAELLAQAASRATPLHQERLAELAAHILGHLQVRDMPQIATACHAVLEAAAVEPSRPKLLSVSHARPLPNVEVDASPATMVVPQLPVAASSQTTDTPAAPGVSTTAASALPEVETPAPPALLPLEVGEARPLVAAETPVTPETTARPIALQPNVAIRAPRPQHEAPLEQLNTVPLAQLLHSADTAVAQSARAELERRGHSPSEIRLQEQLTSPDSAMRTRAAECLPQMPEMDARGWLLTLSRDENANVRLTALTLMATSGEHRMLQRVREMAQADPDPRIRSQAQRVER